MLLVLPSNVEDQDFFSGYCGKECFFDLSFLLCFFSIWDDVDYWSRGTSSLRDRGINSIWALTGPLVLFLPKTFKHLHEVRSILSHLMHEKPKKKFNKVNPNQKNNETYPSNPLNLLYVVERYSADNVHKPRYTKASSWIHFGYLKWQLRIHHD